MTHRNTNPWIRGRHVSTYHSSKIIIIHHVADQSCECFALNFHWSWSLRLVPQKHPIIGYMAHLAGHCMNHQPITKPVGRVVHPKTTQTAPIFSHLYPPVRVPTWQTKTKLHACLIVPFFAYILQNRVNSIKAAW